MEFKVHCKRRVLFACAAAHMLLGSWRGAATGLELESTGFRWGVNNHGDFNQGEVLLDWNLPWRWAWDSGFRLQSKLATSAGWLDGHERTAAIVTAGPDFLLRYKELPFSLEAGSSPTLMTREEFGSRDTGSFFQFTTHIGLNLDIGPHFRLGYRFSHMSNAGIDSDHNDGLNMHMVGLRYVF